MAGEADVNEVCLTIRGPISILGSKEIVVVRVNANLTWEEMFRGENIEISADWQASVCRVGFQPTVAGQCGMQATLNEKIVDFIKMFKKKSTMYVVRLFSPVVRMPYKARVNQTQRISNLPEEEQNPVRPDLGPPGISGAALRSAITTGQRGESSQNRHAMPPPSIPGPLPQRQQLPSEFYQEAEAMEDDGDDQDPFNSSIFDIGDAGRRSPRINGTESTRGAIQPSTTPGQSNQRQQFAEIQHGDDEDAPDHRINQGHQDQQSVTSNLSAREADGAQADNDNDSNHGSDIDDGASVYTQATVENEEMMIEDGLKASMLETLQRFNNQMLTKILQEIGRKRGSNAWDQNYSRSPKAFYFIQELFVEAATMGIEEEPRIWLKPLVIRRLKRFGSGMLRQIQEEIRGQRNNHGWDHSVIITPSVCYILQELFNV